ncbi:hypothetical protein LCGC14_1309920 [marine sediment metagenome]|uniref:Uncharacterized protein n=1 Tax=marine sediment metagenome TaxID=412755 RepID=A0A0F9L7L4_9ZZZZ
MRIRGLVLGRVMGVNMDAPRREPTLAQQEYADNLVDKLRNGGHHKAASFERKVAACEDRREMSSLISNMKEELEGLEELHEYIDKGWPVD